MNDLKNEIIKLYEKYSILFGNDCHKFPFDFFVNDDRGGYHVEYDKYKKYSLVGTDRGQETVRQETYDVDEFMYWIFKGSAFARAQQFELKHRHPTDDPRRVWFPKALQEISQVSPEWKKRMEKEQQEILSRYPFYDRE